MHWITEEVNNIDNQLQNFAIKTIASETEAIANEGRVLSTIFFWSGKADVDFSSVKLFAVQLINCLLVVVIAIEFNKSKAL